MTATTDQVADLAEVTWDIAVVGAGPAGVAAAVTAAESGARVVMIDAGARPGGQYARQPAHDQLRTAAHHPWPEFDDLVSRLERARERGAVSVRHETTVWSASGTGPFTLRLRGGERARDVLTEVQARLLVIATGAHDRPLPFPGWDLPGVMSAGAAQALIKGSGVLPGQRAVVAGTGPFLLAVAATILEAGGQVAAIIEAAAPERLVSRAAALLPAAGHAGELAHFVSLLRRHRVPYRRRHRVIQAHGTDHLTGVSIAAVDRQWRRRSTPEQHIDCDVLAVGFGFTAQLDLLQQLGCEVSAEEPGQVAAVINDRQGTTRPGVFTCGETTGIAGAEVALMEGLIAGAAAARALNSDGLLTDRDVSRLITRVRRLRGAQRALHSTFRVQPGWQDDLEPDTIICRCEEVRTAQVRDAMDALGASDARTVKLMTRAGMGWCQGRMCGFAVEQMCAFANPGHESSSGSARPLITPVPLGALAAGADASLRATPRDSDSAAAHPDATRQHPSPPEGE